ncbi:MAG: gamma-glutamyltransferase [Planctomycetales bacterium]|nr:gamma-glutamyltransferase [Planctomycetales bacterium]
MKKIQQQWLTCLILIGCAGPLLVHVAQADGPRCVVATVQPLATDAGIAAYQRGGNAVDAAIAAALTLGVVDSHNSGLGGGCFILIRCPDGSITAIDGREKAPAAATRDMFVRNGKAQPELSTTGPLASGVPGALAAYSAALAKHGRRELADLLLPAAKIAEEGFAINRSLAAALSSQADTLAKFPGSRQALLKPDGSPYRDGELLRQPDLANSYREMAQHGPDWFYRGPYATAVAEWMAANGGILTADDFAAYECVEREPIVTRYRSWKIIGFPPPSSGGVHVAQILNILEQFDLADQYKRSPPQALHLVIEAMKLAFADRAHWLGDADFVDVPRGLIDKQYAQSLAERIVPEQTIDVPSHGVPPGAAEDFFGKHTTHIAAADAEGYWVAITATINTTFGSKVIVPGTGIVLNDEMDDFSSQPGVPNAFQLLGAENNAVAPGKRPLSSMSPTIVLDEQDKPVMSVGAAGGPKIITQVLMTLVRCLDFGFDLPAAVAAPRYHHQWRPDSVLVETASPAETLEALKNFGHEITSRSQSGVTQAVGLNRRGELIGVHDPRAPGKTGVAE